MTKFDKVLILHCHTSGISYSDDITAGCQALTVALGVVDMSTMKLTHTVDVKVRFDVDSYKWDKKLESIHGISGDDADDTESLKDSAAILGEFLYNHFGIDNAIPVMGYNPLSFHVPFLNKILHSEELYFKFDNRVIDLFTIMMLLDKTTVKDTLDFFDVDQSSPLSSLENIKTYLKIFKTIKTIVKDAFYE
jgi:hypothetical protein